MTDYSKQTWVDETGVGDGTVFTAARMNAMEQGIYDSRKQALLLPGTVTKVATGQASNADGQRVLWTRASDGSYVASVEALETGSGATLADVLRSNILGGLGSTSPTAGAYAEQIIEAAVKKIITSTVFSLEAGIRARRTAGAAAGSAGQVYAEVDDETTGSLRQVKILDDVNASDFVQLGQLAGSTGAKLLKVSAGEAGMTFSASTTSAATTITHGLTDKDGNGVAPFAVFAMARAGIANSAYFVAGSVGTTTFQLTARAAASLTFASNSYPVYWLALALG